MEKLYFNLAIRYDYCCTVGFFGVRTNYVLYFLILLIFRPSLYAKDLFSSAGRLPDYPHTNTRHADSWRRSSRRRKRESEKIMHAKGAMDSENEKRSSWKQTFLFFFTI